MQSSKPLAMIFENNLFTQMKNNIGSYEIERFVNGGLKIDYKRSEKDIYYILAYFLLSLPILFSGFKIIRHLLNEKTNWNVIIGYFFSACILAFGLYLLVVSIETFIKPTKNVFFINTFEERLTIKLNLFKKFQFNFNEIKQFKIGAKDISVYNYNNGRTYKRQLYLIFMHVELCSSKIVKIHQFEGPELLISSFEKKNNKSLKEVSKQITDIISKECGKRFYWEGTQKE